MSSSRLPSTATQRQRVAQFIAVTNASKDSAARVSLIQIQVLDVTGRKESLLAALSQRRTRGEPPPARDAAVYLSIGPSGLVTLEQRLVRFRVLPTLLFTIVRMRLGTRKLTFELGSQYLRNANYNVELAANL